jgi:hypothetical protein
LLSLSLIQSEASQLVGRLPEPVRDALQQELAALCEAHWHELRGPEPVSPLAHALWAVTPPLADLCADLYAAGDERLVDTLRGHNPAQAFALLALAEIERGDAEGARVVHEPMMLFEAPSAGAIYAAHVSAWLHHRWQALELHSHMAKPAWWKALAVIAAQIGRCDSRAVLTTIRLLASPDVGDTAVDRLDWAVQETGVRFLGVDQDHIRFALHGQERDPVKLRQVGEALAEIREVWLAH